MDAAEHVAEWRAHHAPEHEGGHGAERDEVEVKDHGPAEIHAEDDRARHAHDAVLGAEPRRLEGHGVKHLGERQRQHDEVDAAHTDREEPDGERAEAGAERGEEEGGGRAEGAPEEQGSQVAADAEEGGVAEGHHARVAHEQVEAHGEDAPDQDLLEQLHRVGAGEEGEGGEDDDEGGEGGSSEDHRSGRPKSPWGRRSRTRAITT